MKTLRCVWIALVIILPACAPPAVTTPLAPQAENTPITAAVTLNDTPIAATVSASSLESLIGKWRAIVKVEESRWPGVFSLDLKDDGTASLSDTTATEMRGTYKVDGDKVTFNYDYFDPWMKCSAPAIATYTWSLTNKQLTLRKWSDDCQSIELALTTRPLTVRP